MITIKQLTYALAVEKTLHFRKAAEACNVSQSAFSTALSEMEKQLGFQVFERDNKKVLVTPLGKEMLNKAKAIKIQLDDLHLLGDMASEPLSSQLSIGVIPTISSFLFPLVLPNLQKNYPKLQINILEEQSHVLVDKVRQGDIDTAILALPFNTEGLLSFQFWQENFYWVVHKDHPLIQKQQVKVSEINLTELMLLSDGHCLKDHALSVCHLNEPLYKGVNATSLNTLVQLVSNKIGTTLVPEMALEQLVYINPNLKAICLDEQGPHREIVIIVRPNYPLLSNIELLINNLKEALNNKS